MTIYSRISKQERDQEKVKFFNAWAKRDYDLDDLNIVSWLEPNNYTWEHICPAFGGDEYITHKIIDVNSFLNGLNFSNQRPVIYWYDGSSKNIFLHMHDNYFQEGSQACFLNYAKAVYNKEIYQRILKELVIFFAVKDYLNFYIKDILKLLQDTLQEEEPTRQALLNLVFKEKNLFDLLPSFPNNGIHTDIAYDLLHNSDPLMRCKGLILAYDSYIKGKFNSPSLNNLEKHLSSLDKCDFSHQVQEFTEETKFKTRYLHFIYQQVMQIQPADNPFIRFDVSLIHYIRKQFAELNPSNPIYRCYEKMYPKENLEEIITSLKRSLALQKELTPKKTNGDYEKIWEEEDGQFISSAKKLLTDYTKNNSAAMRVFLLCANRTHTKAVHALIKAIDEHRINTMEELLDGFDKIKKEAEKNNKFNKEGSLARRIDFIRHKYHEATLQPDWAIIAEAGSEIALNSSVMGSG